MNYIIGTISGIIVLAPYILFSIGPFRTMLAARGRTVCVLLVAYLVFGGTGAVYFCADISSLPVNLLIFEAYLLIGVALICLICHVVPHNAAYCAFLGINCSTFLACTLIAFFRQYAIDLTQIALLLCAFCIIAIGACLICFLLFEQQISPLLIDGKDIMSIRWYIGAPYAICLLVMVIFCISNFQSETAFILRLSIYILCLACTYISYWINGHLIKTAKANAIIEEQRIKLAQVLQIQEQQYVTLSSYMQEIRAARHDLKHHFSVLERYIRDGDREKLKEYLQEISAINSYSAPSICENLAVNAVVRHYIGLVEQEGVNVEAILDIPANIGFPAADLCIVLGNCLENAFEATRGMGKNGQIRIRSENTSNRLTIVIGNSFAHALHKEGGVYLSTKRGGHPGIGLSSIQAIAGKYGGAATFEEQDNLFITSVILFKPEA